MLDRCSALGPVDLPRISDISKTEVGERGFSATCKAREIFHTSIKQYRIISNRFLAEIHHDISECKVETKCNQASAPSLPIRFHDKSMFFTVLLTFNASTRACEKKRCQTMSNPRTYNAICANIQPRAVATMRNPRKSMNRNTHPRQTEAFSDLFGSFMASTQLIIL